jgi:hypothetical protein
MMSTSKPLELLYIDLFGATAYISIGENNYGFVIIDDFSRYHGFSTSITKVKPSTSSIHLSKK